MSKFKVEQRVKFAHRIPLLRGKMREVPVGSEGTIIGPAMWPTVYDYTVIFDCSKDNPHYCYSEELEPLIDPGAHAFIERIKKLKPYDEPKIVREDAGVPAWPK